MPPIQLKPLNRNSYAGTPEALNAPPEHGRAHGADVFVQDLQRHGKSCTPRLDPAGSRTPPRNGTLRRKLPGTLRRHVRRSFQWGQTESTRWSTPATTLELTLELWQLMRQWRTPAPWHAKRPKQLSRRLGICDVPRSSSMKRIGRRSCLANSAFDDIAAGLKDAIAFANGNDEGAEAHRVHGVDVAALRARLGLTQAEFTALFGVSIATVRNWEQGRRAPRGPARAFLRVIEREP